MDINRLKGKIKERDFTYEYVAKRIGVKRNTIYKKMSGKSYFNLPELEILKKILNLNDKETMEIFFN